RIEQVGTTDAGTLAVRVYQRNDGGFLPPDLEPGKLEHADPGLAKGEKVVLLDIDHYAESEKLATDFSLRDTLDLYWRLHHNTDLAFSAAVTEHARKAWGK